MEGSDNMIDLFAEAMSVPLPLNSKTLKQLYKIVYGWNSKGPIRKKTMINLWKKMEKVYGI